MESNITPAAPFNIVDELPDIPGTPMINFPLLLPNNIQRTIVCASKLEIKRLFDGESKLSSTGEDN